MIPLKHQFDCDCIHCEEARYAIRLSMVDAIRQQAPAAIMQATKTGFRVPSIQQRANLLGIELKAASRNRAAVPIEVCE